MNIITCVGYHATGSGVIDDLFREFDNVAQGHYEAESRILHDPDGVSDLEYHLVENPHRLKTGLAMERFLRYAKENARMYEKIYGDNWLPLCQVYIDSLAKFKFLGYSNSLFVRKPYLRIVLKLYKIINRLRPKPFRKPTWYNYFPNETNYHAAPTEDEFLEKTHAFVEKLCMSIPHNDKTEYVVIDQMTSCDHIARYKRYVPNLKVIVVDRDPRDLFIHHVLHGDHRLPNEPHQFCVHYRDIRKNKSKEDSENALYVTFEDMIYNYDEMIRKVADYVGISLIHHINPKTHFDPAISINGTQQWKKHPEFSKAVAIIEKELPEFLYPYDKLEK